MACVRVPHGTRPDRRVQEIREYTTVTPALLESADWLRVERVELVAMKATSDYWKPVFYLLEAEGFECWLLNAKHVKNVPGRPKTNSARRGVAGVRRWAWCTPGSSPSRSGEFGSHLTALPLPTVRPRCATDGKHCYCCSASYPSPVC